MFGLQQELGRQTPNYCTSTSDSTKWKLTKRQHYKTLQLYSLDNWRWLWSKTRHRSLQTSISTNSLAPRSVPPTLLFSVALYSFVLIMLECLLVGRWLTIVWCRFCAFSQSILFYQCQTKYSFHHRLLNYSILHYK